MISNSLAMSNYSQQFIAQFASSIQWHREASWTLPQQNYAATSDHSTAGTTTERQQRSPGNVCAPCPTVHDEHDANTTTAVTWMRLTKWRTRQWTQIKQHWMAGSVGEDPAAAEHTTTQHELWKWNGGQSAENPVLFFFEFQLLPHLWRPCEWRPQQHNL